MGVGVDVSRGVAVGVGVSVGVGVGVKRGEDVGRLVEVDVGEGEMNGDDGMGDWPGDGVTNEGEGDTDGTGGRNLLPGLVKNITVAVSNRRIKKTKICANPPRLINS